MPGDAAAAPPLVADLAPRRPARRRGPRRARGDSALLFRVVLAVGRHQVLSGRPTALLPDVVPRIRMLLVVVARRLLMLQSHVDDGLEGSEQRVPMDLNHLGDEFRSVGIRKWKIAGK